MQSQSESGVERGSTLQILSCDGEKAFVLNKAAEFSPLQRRNGFYDEWRRILMVGPGYNRNRKSGSREEGRRSEKYNSAIANRNRE